MTPECITVLDNVTKISVYNIDTNFSEDACIVFIMAYLRRQGSMKSCLSILPDILNGTKSLGRITFGKTLSLENIL